MINKVIEELGKKTFQGVTYTFIKVEEEAEKGFLGKFGDMVTDEISNRTGQVAEKTGEIIVKTLGYTVFSLANVGQQLAVIGIIVGIYLLIFKRTKVLRYSIITYLVSIVLELIGTLLIG